MENLFGKDKNQYLDMTAGKPIKLVLQFSLPLIAGNLFQQLYSFTDAAVIGNFIGVNGFAAVSCASWIIWLINSACRDSSNAFSIAASYRIGGSDADGFRRIAGNAVTAGLFLATITASCLVILLHRILDWLSVPVEIRSDARTYLTILSIGIPFGFCFHITAGLLRAAGNSRVTFRAMAISTLGNLFLDYLFVIRFHWSVAGAAAATVLAQASSSAIAFHAAAHSDKFQLRRKDLIPDRTVMREVFRLWFPMMFNTVAITVGGLAVQKAINSVGPYFVAGNEASGTVFNVLESVIMAIMTATGVFVGQNLGAGRYERVRTGMREAVFAALILTGGMIALVFTFSRPLIAFLLKSENAEVLSMAQKTGVLATRILVCSMIVMTPMYLYRFTLQTMGYQRFIMVAAVMQTIARIGTVRLLPSLLGENAYFLSNLFAWMATFPLVAIPYYQKISSLCRGEHLNPDSFAEGSGNQGCIRNPE